MDDHPSSRGRETFLTIFLVIVFGGAFVFFLDFISMGIVSVVFKVIIGMTVIGSIHYLLWGHSLSQEVAGEREEYELQQRLQAEKDGRDNPY